MSAAPPAPKGLSQSIDGVRLPPSASPLPDRPATSATTAKTRSAPTWAMIRPFCSLALVSVPITHTQVIAKMSTTVRVRTRKVFSASPSSCRASNPNRTPVSASEPMTSTPVIEMAQPPIQPTQGPMARVTQENVVPQSWSARFR